MTVDNPLSLLPQTVGEENAIQITRSQKSRLNKALTSEGYSSTFGPDHLYTDWVKERTLYRIYHSGARSTIIKLEEFEDAGNPDEPDENSGNRLEDNEQGSGTNYRSTIATDGEQNDSAPKALALETLIRGDLVGDYCRGIVDGETVRVISVQNYVERFWTVLYEDSLGRVQTRSFDRELNPVQFSEISPLIDLEEKQDSSPQKSSELEREPDSQRQQQLESGSSTTPLERLGLNKHAYNALRRANIDTVEQLATMTEEEVQGLNRVGTKTAKEILSKFDAFEEKDECTTLSDSDHLVDDKPEGSIQKRQESKILEASERLEDSKLLGVEQATQDSHHGLLVGMYVRFPVDLEREDREFRDYYLGRIERFEEIADTVIVAMKSEAIGEDSVYEQRECPRAYVRRCRILPGTPFTHVETGEKGVIVSGCTDAFESVTFYDYYVQVDGGIQRFSEREVVVPSHRADPSPKEQLYNYEFHHPSFKSPRDRLVASYAELRAATFGIEDLVGSRIMLLAHQAEVVSTVLRDPECRYVLADEVGLGKTVEASVILKGLRRRHPNLRTLIIAPGSLVAQWYYELDQKFWLRFATRPDLELFLATPSIPGLIISAEELERDSRLALILKMQEWGLLIVDEAHHIHKKQALFEHISELSESAERALILSATPIQRRAEEFLALLKLVDPTRYEPISRSAFKEIVAAQYKLMRAIVSIVPDLTQDYFDPRYFQEEIADIMVELGQDTQLESLLAQVAETADRWDRGLQAAKDVIAYISENYRIERRVIRNRRVNLKITLPERAVDASNAYTPESAEREALENLHQYVDEMIRRFQHSRSSLAYAQLLLHAGLSSPHALLKLIEWRQEIVQQSPAQKVTDPDWDRLTTPAAPRREPERIKALFHALRPLADEAQQLDDLKWYVERWQNRTDMALEMLPYRSDIPPLPHRIARVLRQVYQQFAQHRAAKIVIFSSWYETLSLLAEQLRRHWGSQAVAEFHINLNDEQLQEEVDRFQSDENCQILLCDELGGEGRNFQIADLVVHADLPWTPALVEQRIGRVDRFGREGQVLSAVPFARETVEEDLYRIWQEAFHLFTQSMSGMEIALEEIQDELLAALGGSSRSGLQLQLEEMVEKAADLREQVEEERFYEEEAIDERRREEFQRLSERYRDGHLLRQPVLKWAEQTGLRYSYKPETDMVRYYPKQFNSKMMRNAKFVDLPNMEEALARSRHKNTPWITGTFNRSMAVNREDLVFFAPGSDPWTDALVHNAIEADRGRACAINRISDDVDEPWAGLELFYRFRVDPRPILALEHEPIHLLRAQGYLHMPVYRLLISIKGEVLPTSDPLYEITQKPFSRYQQDKHLGKREGSSALLPTFKQVYPDEEWHSLLARLFRIAEKNIIDRFSFTNDLAEEAEQDFARQARGMRAACSWQLQRNAMDHVTVHEELAAIETYEAISKALVTGIRQPQWWLESACFWLIQPSKS